METAQAIHVIQANQGRITQASLAAQAGIDQARAIEVLKHLVLQYRCTLKVTDDGDVIYDFGPDFMPRNTLARRISDVFLVIRRHATDVLLRLLQVWVLIFLFVYTIVFIVVTVGTFSAADVITKLFVDMAKGVLDALLGRNSTHRMLYEAVKGQGRRLWEADWARVDKAKIPLHEKVWTAFFGTLTLPLTRARRRALFMSYVNQVGGVVVPVEWATFFECDLEAADQEITELYASYGADVRVTDDGTLVYDFSAVLGKGFEQDLPVPCYLYSGLQHELGKDKHVNSAQGLNLLNLIAGSGYLAANYLGWIHASPLRLELLGLVPAAVSLVLFLFALSRSHTVFSRVRLFRRALFYHVMQYAKGQDPTLPADVQGAVQILDKKCPFPVRAVSDQAFTRTLAMLKADMQHDADVFDFPLVKDQLDDVQLVNPEYTSKS